MDPRLREDDKVVNGVGKIGNYEDKGKKLWWKNG
ncbi:MAG: hypothetical protein ACJA02_000323 [Myxococcota bacterium]|jgi:hypothetical protein